jgi:hypothetical protein
MLGGPCGRCNAFVGDARKTVGGPTTACTTGLVGPTHVPICDRYAPNK